MPQTDPLVSASVMQRDALRRADSYQPRVTAYQREIARALREWREARQWLAMCGGRYLRSPRLSEYEEECHAAYERAKGAIRRAKELRDGVRS